MRKMRAKVRVSGVFPNPGATSERVLFSGVAASRYPADGSDEDNTFAKFSPSVAFDMMIANPALVGSFKVGDTFYVDFLPVE